MLQRAGWVLRRISGSHHIYKKPGHSRLITVPVHGNKTLGPGLLLRILRDAGLPLL
ncbi:MAG: type II toxin-antitoxin system HicA family toxin [Acidobacteria bacterium]|nr:type II toxin-antitoxin system HicA family toxin [Acidobacteriota bacterium]